MNGEPESYLPKDNQSPEVGDIWQEVDPRLVRYVRVESVGTGRRSIAIRRVSYTALCGGRRWSDHPKGRLSYADIERFNGRRGGYKLHERGEQP